MTPNLSIIKGKISCGSTHDVTNKFLCQGLYMKQNGEVTSLAKESDEIMRGNYIPRLKRDEIRNLVRNLTKEHGEIALFSFFFCSLISLIL